MMRINIIGAGLAGLLAANMLRRYDIIVYERQKNLPNNHHAVLRFRTPNVGDVLGIQFKKVNMIKTYVPFRNVVADSLSYSYKCTGKYKSDRSIVSMAYAGREIENRYVAPPDLIEQMSKNIHIKYEIDYEFYNDSNLPVISTIPMPILMDILGYDYANKIDFNYLPGVVATATVQDCDAYISVLFPGTQPYSRATITGNQLMIEFPGSGIPETTSLAEVYFHLGLDGGIFFDLEFKRQQYFKITEIDDAERKKFQRWATVNHNIYSLGRYATWRPKLLLDDLVQDIKKIEEWIGGGK